METLEEVLAHYGVKGMKWGRRKSDLGSLAPPSEDYTRVAGQRAVAKTSGTRALSNKDLQEVITRMNLEQSYSRLNPKSNPVKNGQNFVKEGLAIFGTVSALYGAVNSPLGKAMRTALNNSGKPTYLQEKIF